MEAPAAAIIINHLKQYEDAAADDINEWLNALHLVEDFFAEVGDEWLQHCEDKKFITWAFDIVDDKIMREHQYDPPKYYVARAIVDSEMATPEFLNIVKNAIKQMGQLPSPPNAVPEDITSFKLAVYSD